MTIPKTIFDHIPKTGGVAFGEALYAILPAGTVSPRQQLGGDPMGEGLDSRWRVVRGHFGHLYSGSLDDYAERLKITIIREPVTRFISEYKYWRWKIADDRPEASIHYVQAAKTQPFSSFIRWWLEQDNNANFQAAFLSGAPDQGPDPEARAKEILSRYDIVGTNDDLAGVLVQTLHKLGWHSAEDPEATLFRVEPNRSDGSVDVTDEDLAFMEERCHLDIALYNEAKRRAQRPRYASSRPCVVNEVKAPEISRAAVKLPSPSFISYSANFEDVILHRLFAQKQTGFYVDVGAGHPLHDNDTMALYKRGWSGINVEPNPHFNALLDEHRSRDRNLCIAMGNRPGKATYYEVVGTGLSTCHPDNAEKARQQGYSILKRKIVVRTLGDILSEAEPPAIDLLKIDVEGWEEQVIAGNDWEQYRPSVILVEATIPESPQRRASGERSYLEERGYRWVYFDGLNDFYVEKDFVFPECAFAVPPNVFDGFNSNRVFALENRVGELEQSLESARLDIAAKEADRYRQATVSEARIALQHRVIGVEEALETATHNIAKLEQDITDLEADRNRQVTAAETHIRELEQRVQEVEKALRSAKLDITDLEADRFRLATAADKMRHELISAAAELNTLHADREALLVYQRRFKVISTRHPSYALAPILFAIHIARRIVRRLKRRPVWS